MNANEIRSMIKAAERRAKNVYMAQKSPGHEPCPPVRIINAREKDGSPQVFTIGGRWVSAELGQGSIYEQ